MAPPPKYIFQNGIMKINPAYTAAASSSAQQQQSSTLSNPSEALAVVSSMDDIMAATEASEPGAASSSSSSVKMSESTMSSIEIMQDADYLNKFGGEGSSSSKMDGGQLLDKISTWFSRYEVPMGLLNKLIALCEYRLHFTIDDSSSMELETDVYISAATSFLKERQLHNKRVSCSQSPHQSLMTRWEEAEDRMHILVDILALVPTGVITVRCLNASTLLTFVHRGQGTDEFARDAHAQVSKLFDVAPRGGTPIYRALETAFQGTHTRTMHYLFTDGVPNDKSVSSVRQLVVSRPNPSHSPLTFITCSNEDADAEWMKQVESEAPFCAEVDDFEDERREVANKQGQVFPYSKGFWLLCHLVAAINPDDLDALDDEAPFTKCTMDTLMGRVLTSQEYDKYFQEHPQYNKYRNYQAQFQRTDLLAKQIAIHA